jgi:hypothetical protein
MNFKCLTNDSDTANEKASFSMEKKFYFFLTKILQIHMKSWRKSICQIVSFVKIVCEAQLFVRRKLFVSVFLVIKSKNRLMK